MNDIEKQFLEELNTLLKKYNADISVDEDYAEIDICGFKGIGESFESFNISRKYFDGDE